jgi:hypothetical protein
MISTWPVKITSRSRQAGRYPHRSLAPRAPHKQPTAPGRDPHEREYAAGDCERAAGRSLGERERERRGGWWRGKVRPLKVPAGAEARSKGRAARPGGEPPFWHRPPARHHGGGQRRGRGPRCVFKAALGSARQVGRRHVMVLPPASNSTLLGVFFFSFWVRCLGDRASELGGGFGWLRGSIPGRCQ